MIDARNIYRQVTRKIYDFSPEQEKNILAIVHLYRGQTERYLHCVSGYCRTLLDEALGCFEKQDESGDIITPLHDFMAAVLSLFTAIVPFVQTLKKDDSPKETWRELDNTFSAF